MLVYVLKQNGQPFMPTARFGKIRRLLKAVSKKSLKGKYVVLEGLTKLNILTMSILSRVEKAQGLQRL